MILNILLFLYQTITTLDFLRQRHPEYWPSHAASMLADTLVGSSLPGPLVRDFAFSPHLAKMQPHRYLTSGFLHGGILHLLVNLDTWRRQPAWLETGLGAPLYLTTFFISIVAGNLGLARGISNNPLDPAWCLGASGGICGLYGLMYASLIRMGNREAARRIFRGMATLTLASLFLESVSTLSHIGGFVAGVVMAIFFSPSYKKNYMMRRKNSTEYDPAPRDFRQAMGFGIMATERGMLPLALLWAALACAWALAGPTFRAMPALVLKGFLFPGSLSS
jgi:membrane associated rhomboid family serine protease